MATKSLDSHQARNNWRDVLDTVLIEDTDVVITRYNKPLVALVAYEDYLSVRDALNRHRAERQLHRQQRGEAMATMLASEAVLARDWDTPEEDEAWRDL